jgi:hypothetical protein
MKIFTCKQLNIMHHPNTRGISKLFEFLNSATIYYTQFIEEKYTAHYPDTLPFGNLKDGTPQPEISWSWEEDGCVVTVAVSEEHGGEYPKTACHCYLDLPALARCLPIHASPVSCSAAPQVRVLAEQAKLEHQLEIVLVTPADPRVPGSSDPPRLRVREDEVDQPLRVRAV